MQLKLVSVHLRNFRIHEDYTFEPQPEGITAICGQNGHGKSTIIDSISWALFGTKPNRSMKNKDLRREDAPEDEDSYVDLVLTVDGQTLRVKRSITNINGGTNCECWLDDNHEAGPAVSHAERWIVKTLGMDEDSFLSTVLVQQKQVGALVDSSPSGRRRTLEKLTGIAAVTKALEAAHNEELGYSRAAQSFSIDEDSVPRLEKQIDKLNADLQKSQEQFKKLDERRSKLKAEGTEARVKVNNLEAIGNKYRSLETEQETLKTKVDFLTQRQEELMKKREELKKDLPKTIGTEESSKELEDKLSSLEESLSSANMTVKDLKKTISLKAADEELEKLKSGYEGLKKDLDSRDRESLTTALSEMNRGVSDCKARIRQANKSLKELNGKNVEATCPTCLQPISDIEHVKKELDDGITAAEDEMKTLEAKAAGISNQIEEYDVLKVKVDVAKTAVEDAKDTVKKAKTASDQLVDAMANVKSLKTESTTLRKTVSRLAADKVKREQYESVLDDFTKTTNDLNVSIRRQNALKDEIKDVGKGFTWNRLDKARKDLEDKRSRYSDVDNKAVAKNGEIDLIKEKIKGATRELENVKEKIENKKSLMKHLEVSTGNVAVLSAFRENKILNAIPQITDYASDFIRKVTEGKFTDIEIDSKFNINVSTDEGSTRDISMLSGGERDAVALCLRLAISIMLSGGEQSLMILDEPITSQDSNRAELMLNTIESMNDGQVIIVAHNEIIQSIADNIVPL